MFVLAVAMILAGGGVRAEGFVDLYVGGGFNQESDVAAELVDGAGFVTRVKWENSFVPGVRGGYWVDALPWLGFSLDLSYFEVKQKVAPTDESILQLDVVPLSGLLMVRYPMLVSTAFPHGQVYPYAAIGPAGFMTTMTGELLEGGFSGDFKDSQKDVGLDFRLGAKMFHAVKSWGAFAEYRLTYFQPSKFKDQIGIDEVVIQPNRLLTHYMIFGVGYHF